MRFGPVVRPIEVRRHNRANILKLLGRYAAPGAVVYDIGCGDKFFALHVRELGCSYIGLDTANRFYKEKPELIGLATQVPAPDQAVDIVILSQVLEHLEQPCEALKEAYRILKPGGILLYSSPFLYPIHAVPCDYGRYTRFFIAAMAERLGFEILTEAAVDGYWRASAVAFAIYAQSFDRGPLKYLGLIPAITAIQQWLCVGMHKVETLALRLAGKRPDGFHQTFPVNYIFALGKRGPR